MACCVFNYSKKLLMIKMRQLSSETGAAISVVFRLSLISADSHTVFEVGTTMLARGLLQLYLAQTPGPEFRYNRLKIPIEKSYSHP